MSLIDNFNTLCVLLEKKRVPDGEGGFISAWEEGPEFMAAIVLDQSLQAQIAYKQGVTSLYRVTAPKSLSLEFHDVFRRVSDGQTFRITSNAKDKETPVVASFSFSQVTAEEWSLPQ